MILLSDQQIKDLAIIFEVVIKANKMTLVKDNIYKDAIGTRFYLDTLGFHTCVQYANCELIGKEHELDKLIKKYSHLISNDNLSNRSVNRIYKILSRKDIKDKDKLNDIKKTLGK